MTIRLSKNVFGKGFASTPLIFIPNEGQVDSRAKYHIQGTGYGFYFTQGEMIITFIQKNSTESNRISIALQFIGANPDVEIEGLIEASGKINYFNGNDQSKWITNLPTYEKIVYKELWKGIDLVFYCKDNSLKYDFILQPGASVDDIKLAYRGSNGISLDDEGNLQVHNDLGLLIDERPISYQDIEGKKVMLESNFNIENQKDKEILYGFEVSHIHNPDYPLVIDPGLVFSTFLGALIEDVEDAEADKISIAIDDSRDIYVAGETLSPDFPVTLGAFEENPPLGFETGYVTKLNSDGSGLIYSTFLGGSGTDESCRSIAVDCMGNAYVTGETDSPDFPVTLGAFQEVFPSRNNASSAFVTKLSPDGSKLIYSTFLGGGNDDEGNDIAIDIQGNAYVTGETHSFDFPVTLGAFQENLPSFFEGAGPDIPDSAFVAKLNPDGSDLVYSTFLGGSGQDEGIGIALDDKGNAYVTGETDSTDFPTTLDAFQEEIASIIDPDSSPCDAFVTKLNPDGSGLVYSTFLGGGSIDDPRSIAVDSMGNAYIVGETESSDFPVTLGAFQEKYGGGNDDVFVTKLSPDGSDLIYSTFLGGSDNDEGHGIAIDEKGNAYVTGFTNSPDFPVTVGAFQEVFQGTGESDYGDAFVAKLSSDGSSLLYSTFLGGSEDDFGRDIVVDEEGNAYVIGVTTSSNFPVTLGAFTENFRGNLDDGFFDTFIAKIIPISIL